MKLRRDPVLKSWMVAIWLICLYRAITQSIVHDEALTYGLYLAGPASDIFQVFSPNHHFLNTLLMKLSVSIFGVSEWSMRLPALAGASLYLAAVYRICIREFQTNLASCLAAALLTLNPFLLDFMVAARGYGMALGLLMWALAVLLEYVRKPDRRARRELLEAGIGLSLSVWANLVFVIPAAVLVGGTWLLLKQYRSPAAPEPEPAAPTKKRQRKRKRPVLSDHDLALQAFWRWLVIPAVCGLVLLFLTYPLAKATSGDFYAGAESVGSSLRSLYDVSLAHGGPVRRIAMAPVLRDIVAFGLAPMIILGALALAIRRRDPLLLLAAGTAAASAILLVALNLTINLRYPLDRTGIYFPPLASLALAGLVEEIEGKGPLRVAGAVACGIAVALIVQFLQEFDTHKFIVWEYDADTRAILGELAKAVPDKRPNAIRILNSWQLEPSLAFYAVRDNLNWIQPVNRAPIAPGADYYVLIAPDRGAIESLHLKTLYTGPNSGTVLSAPAR